MRSNYLPTFAGLLAAMAMPCVASADSATIGAAADNTLYEDGAGALSNGAGASFFAGINNASLARRGAIRFDVAGLVPAGATITAVALTLNMSNTGVGAVPVSLHRCLSAWGEGTSNATMGGGGGGAASTAGDATWIHSTFPGALWSTAGGDFAAPPSATALVGAVGFHSWTSTPALIADVQGWLDAPASNNGWIVVGDESTFGTVKRFDTRENATPANRPSLAIAFTPAPSGVGCWSLYD